MRILVLAMLCCTPSSSVQAQQKQADPESEKQFGFWLDQWISKYLSSGESLEVEVNERLD